MSAAPSPAHSVLWLADADRRVGAALPAPPLDGELEVDVCVVGGGYVGLWTALRLRELAPERTVALLEADRCGGAASGRNGGFVHSWWLSIGALTARVGEAEALRLARLSGAAVEELAGFCARERIAADLVPGGWLWTSTAPAQDGAWAGAVARAAREPEPPLRALDGGEIRRRLGSPVHRGGALEPGGMTLQPALLARGLRRVALARGVRICERTPMVALDRDAGVVTTPGGRVRAGTVVLALGAWAAQLRELRSAVVAVASDVVATAPLGDALARSGWRGGEGVSNARTMVDYYRTTADGRIVFGRGGGMLGRGGRIGGRLVYDPGRVATVSAALDRLVPAARGVARTDAWGGAVDRSNDGLPLLGRLRGRAPVLYATGLSGNGVGPSLVCARVLASRALGIDDRWSRAGLWQRPPARFPPEPLRTLGGRLVRAAVERREEREDDGRAPDPLTRLLAGLAPGSHNSDHPGEERPPR